MASISWSSATDHEKQVAFFLDSGEHATRGAFWGLKNYELLHEAADLAQRSFLYRQSWSARRPKPGSAEQPETFFVSELAPFVSPRLLMWAVMQQEAHRATRDGAYITVWGYVPTHVNNSGGFSNFNHAESSTCILLAGKRLPGMWFQSSSGLTQEPGSHLLGGVSRWHNSAMLSYDEPVSFNRHFGISPFRSEALPLLEQVIAWTRAQVKGRQLAFRGQRDLLVALSVNPATDGILRRVVGEDALLGGGWDTTKSEAEPTDSHAGFRYGMPALDCISRLGGASGLPGGKPSSLIALR